MDTDDTLLLDNQLCFALYGLSRKMTSLYRPLLKPLGLTYPQYLVMLVMWEEQVGTSESTLLGVSVQFLGDRLLLDTGTLTPLLKRLEKQGLLTRSRDSSDERRLCVRLTDAGLGLRERAQAVPVSMLCKSPVAPGDLLVLQAELMGLLKKFK